MTLRNTLSVALIALAFGYHTPSAFAQPAQRQARPGAAVTRPDAVNARQRLQQRRIQLNQRRGTLTATERNRLLSRQRVLREMTLRLRRSGGGLSPRERIRLHRQLNQLSWSIRRFGRR